MNKNDRYKIVFESAKEFLHKIIDNNNLDKSILEKYLQYKSEFDSIMEANHRLIRSLSNRNMMPSVIGFSKREKEMASILLGYDPNKILAAYNDVDDLLKVFKNKFNLKNLENKGNLWRIFSGGVISGSKFMSSFRDKDDLDSFIKNFARNKYTKAALPMLLSKEIKGFGFALACDFLKELGYRDYPKPDVHLIKIFYNLRLADSSEPYEVYKSIIEMVEVVGEDAYTVDQIFWLIGSGRFHLDDVKVGRNGDKFIKQTKAKL